MFEKVAVIPVYRGEITRLKGEPIHVVMDTCLKDVHSCMLCALSEHEGMAGVVHVYHILPDGTMQYITKDEVRR